MQQYFIKQHTAIGERVIFDSEQSHHLQKVLRMGNNDKVLVVTLDGKKYLVALEIEEKNVFGRCVEEIKVETNSVNVVLVLALIKKDKWDIALQKAAELQATKIVPLMTERTVIKLNEQRVDKQIARWNKIALEASEQSKRFSLCQVEEPIEIKDLVNYLQDINLVAYEKSNTSSHISRFLTKGKSILIVIGPEGGFSASEITSMEELGLKCCSLGSNVLRAETASMYALSVISYVNEEMK